MKNKKQWIGSWFVMFLGGMISGLGKANRNDIIFFAGIVITLLGYFFQVKMEIKTARGKIK